MKDKYIVSPAPHVHDKSTVKNVMWNVVIALIPALLFAVYYWGLRALILTLTGAIAAVITEAIIQKLRKVPVTVHDGSAFLTGMLLAYNIHVGAPIWLPIVGAVFAIGVGKQVFGGLGNNPVNPALLGRAFLLASWPTQMTAGWVAAKNSAMSGLNNLSRIATNLQELSPKAYELVTGATPLKVAQSLRDTSFVADINAQAGGLNLGGRIFDSLTELATLKNLFWGNIGGCIGEVSAFALLLGAAYLLYRNIIEWRIPLFYIGTVFVLSLIFGGIPGSGSSVMLPFFHIFAGGLMLGAFFMATDYTTTPITKKGRIIFGIGCGLLTIVIRLVGGYPEGVSYSILLMNVFTPLIDKITMPKPFGKVAK
ncbi:MAG: RnfABCDGE type electron transport complex subunit D [Candidatus Cloacimonetes bacterium]|nr:RnfABCDGE type electron transport complex subunit D [Candidatus Cloacimonadota bacterium]MDD2682762.1 RnfABCDGE type electron transport complex subunit D [Candidatus Cloacimonadota bacterium]MDD3578407.1 RnfABCDGE type electron transport complex subunit D [Candidatus Cloacimonadota bacterium]HPF08597.1 RnfABCDGE type electron transport complex subunit D [Candidatus Cloacimonadota bacterium]